MEVLDVFSRGDCNSVDLGAIDRRLNRWELVRNGTWNGINNEAARLHVVCLVPLRHIVSVIGDDAQVQRPNLQVVLV